MACDLAQGVSSATPISARDKAVRSPSAQHRVLPLGVPGPWTLRFDDEFSGTSLDLSKWNPSWYGSTTTLPSMPVVPQDLSCNAPSALTESAGALSIKASAQPCTTDNGHSFSYTGGLINTWNKFEFTYGYMEARMYIPAGANGQPVDTVDFWADGTGQWPSTGELDVMEVLGGCGTAGQAGLAYHFHSPSGAPGQCVPLPNPTGWHTFGADWQPGSVTYYYDGTPVGHITTGITGAPMYLILSNGVDPTWGGPTSVPSTALVDYVRVWQSSPATTREVPRPVPAGRSAGQRTRDDRP
jgi:beta-glucanase (GH16 family)